MQIQEKKNRKEKRNINFFGGVIGGGLEIVLRDVTRRVVEIRQMR